MTDQEVIAKAIDKARYNGWRLPGNWTSRDEFITYELNPDCPDKWHKFKSMALLLDKDFAKALWGEELYEITSIQSGPFYGIDGTHYQARLPRYMVELQSMVISDDPIEYLKENL